MLDSLMWWMNKPIVDVYADLKTVVPKFEGPDGNENRDAEDFFAIMGHFEDGTSFIANLYYPAVRGSGWNLEILGTKGTLIMKNDTDITISTGEEFQDIKIEESEESDQLTPLAKPYFKGLYPMFDSVYKSISSHKPYPNTPTLIDGHLTQLVMDAIRESAAKKTRTIVRQK